MGDTLKIKDEKECKMCEEAKRAFSLIKNEKLAVLCLECGKVWKTEEMEEFEVE